MKHVRMSVVLGAMALGSIPLGTLGETARTDPALLKPPVNAATMMCRPAFGGERPNGTVDAQGVVCKSMQTAMAGGMMKVPRTQGLDGRSADHLWRVWVEQALMIPRAGDGGG